jgi:hypothetical protein
MIVIMQIQNPYTDTTIVKYWSRMVTKVTEEGAGPFMRDSAHASRCGKVFLY